MAGYGNTPRDAGQIPMSTIWVPGGANPVPLQGGPATTDVNGNLSAPAAFVHAAVTVLNLASAARATYSSGPLNVGYLAELAFDIKVTAFTGGTTPTVTFKLSRIGADGQLYQLYLPTAISAAGTFSTSIGSGLATNSSFGSQVQVDMIATGAPTSVTFSGSLIGK